MVHSEPPCSRTSLRRPRILLVDDDPAVIRGLWRILRRHRPEYQVNTAASAAQALQALSELNYDVVVTDLQMPGGGEAVLEALERSYPGTGRVLHSSQPETRDTPGGQAAHVVLAKLASEFEIVAGIEQALQRAASERQRSHA